MEQGEVEINEIELNDELKSCILCLFPVSETGETKLYKLPCECNTLCHKTCFKKLHNKRKCFICKIKYKKPAGRDKNEDVFLYEEIEVNTDSDDSGDSYDYFDYDGYVMRMISGVSENSDRIEPDELNDDNGVGVESEYYSEIAMNIFALIMCVILFFFFLFFSGILVNGFLYFWEKKLVINIYSYEIFVYGLIGTPFIFGFGGCAYKCYNRFLKDCVRGCRIITDEGIR